ncbi:MAG TPA: hypothetical protein PLQ93_12935 [Bacteroidia bacterium]|nr:hypothetical protein [Bacteroidia bacterium]
MLTGPFESYAQNSHDSDAFAFLGKEKRISLMFNYDQLQVEDIWTIKSMWKTGDSSLLKPELEFLRLKSEKYDKKRKGRGKQWIENWERNKKYNYEPRFEKYFNKGTKHKLVCSRFVDTLKYTMQVNVKEMRLGGNGNYAVCSFEVLIFETKIPNRILTKTLMEDVYSMQPGSADDFVSSFLFFALLRGTFPSNHSKRVKKCYVNCGRDFAKEIRLSYQKKKPPSLRDSPIFID